MIFLSYWFLIFALVFFPLYFLVRAPRLRLLVLAVSCAVFHTEFAGPAGVIPIIILALLTYGCGLSRHKHLCTFAMVVCTMALVFYKYTLFIADTIASIAPVAGSQLQESAQRVLPPVPPLAISFFVFEFVHYLYEVRHGGPPIRNPLHFGLFAVFWPSLVAGPIKRYQQYLPSLLTGVATVGSADAIFGMLRVTGGMLKKVVADNLTLWIDFHAARYETLDLPTRWLFLLFLALRIYLDFSGYSDMAIGYAHMMGIRLPENFNWPYIARSIDEFWRRWHISLSSWIRDYVYIPLGGSRHGLARRIINGLVAFTICGLWHGAAWNFALWGLYHGIGLAVSTNYVRVTGQPGRQLSTLLKRVPLLSTALTFFFVCSGWLLFFYPAATAWQMFVLLFRPS